MILIYLTYIQSVSPVRRHHNEFVTACTHVNPTHQKQPTNKKEATSYCSECQNNNKIKNETRLSNTSSTQDLFSRLGKENSKGLAVNANNSTDVNDDTTIATTSTHNSSRDFERSQSFYNSSTNISSKNLNSSNINTKYDRKSSHTNVSRMNDPSIAKHYR